MLTGSETHENKTWQFHSYKSLQKSSNLQKYGIKVYNFAGVFSPNITSFGLIFFVLTIKMAVEMCRHNISVKRCQY